MRKGPYLVNINMSGKYSDTRRFVNFKIIVILLLVTWNRQKNIFSEREIITKKLEIYNTLIYTELLLFTMLLNLKHCGTVIKYEINSKSVVFFYWKRPVINYDTNLKPVVFSMLKKTRFNAIPLTQRPVITRAFKVVLWN